MTFYEIINALKINNIKLTPCSAGQVQAIEAYFNVRLPKTYVDFLLWMGVDAGKYMRGDSCFYEDIFDLRAWAIELIEENDFLPLPENAFVFWMHQGYQFAFFKIGDGDNPAVYYYNETIEGMTEYRDSGSLIDFYYVMLKMSRIIE